MRLIERHFTTSDKDRIVALARLLLLSFVFLFSFLTKMNKI